MCITGMERRICSSPWFHRQVIGSWCKCKIDCSASAETSMDDDDYHV